MEPEEPIDAENLNEIVQEPSKRGNFRSFYFIDIFGTGIIQPRFSHIFLIASRKSVSALLNEFSKKGQNKCL